MRIWIKYLWTTLSGINRQISLNFRSSRLRQMSTFLWIFWGSRATCGFRKKMTMRTQFISLMSRRLNRFYKSMIFRPNDRMWKGASLGFRGPLPMDSGSNEMISFSNQCLHTATTSTRTIHKYLKRAFIGSSKDLCITMLVKYAWSWLKNIICWTNSDLLLSWTECNTNSVTSTLSASFWKTWVILKSKGHS